MYVLTAQEIREWIILFIPRIGHSRAVYEVNLSEAHESVPGSSPTGDIKARRQEEMPIPVKTAVVLSQVFFLFSHLAYKSIQNPNRLVNILAWHVRYKSLFQHFFALFCKITKRNDQVLRGLRNAHDEGQFCRIVKWNWTLSLHI